MLFNFLNTPYYLFSVLFFICCTENQDTKFKKVLNPLHKEFKVQSNKVCKIEGLILDVVPINILQLRFKDLNIKNYLKKIGKSNLILKKKLGSDIYSILEQYWFGIDINILSSFFNSRNEIIVCNIENKNNKIYFDFSYIVDFGYIFLLDKSLFKHNILKDKISRISLNKYFSKKVILHKIKKCMESFGLASYLDNKDIIIKIQHENYQIIKILIDIEFKIKLNFIYFLDLDIIIPACQISLINSKKLDHIFIKYPKWNFKNYPFTTKYCLETCLLIKPTNFEFIKSKQDLNQIILIKIFNNKNISLIKKQYNLFFKKG